MPDERLTIIGKIRESNKKLVLFGTGIRSNVLTDMLAEYHVFVSGYCVDNEYYDENMYFREKKVFSFDSIILNGSEYIVLIAFQNYKRAKDLMEKCNGQCEMYYIDDPYDFFKMDYNFVLKNVDNLDELYNRLGDDISKDVMVAFINTRISGNPEEIYQLRSGENHQYDYNVLNIGEDEVMVDCGSFDGDTIADYLRYTNNRVKKIYACEPDDKNIGKINQRFNEQAIRKLIQIVPMGVWSEETVLKFAKGKDSASSFNNSSTVNRFIADELQYNKVPVTTIDKIIGGDEATFIKMDIEGSELDALKGAEKTIRRCYPKLAICVYHKERDLVDIPNYIMSLENDTFYYKFYMRHHSVSLAETVLYAIPVKK